MKKFVFLVLFIFGTIVLGFSSILVSKNSGNDSESVGNSKKKQEYKWEYIFYNGQKIRVTDSKKFEALNEYYIKSTDGKIYYYNKNYGLSVNPLTEVKYTPNDKYQVYDKYLLSNGKIYMDGRIIAESHENEYKFDFETLKIIGIQEVEGEQPCGGKDWTGSCRVIHRDLIFTDKNGVYITIENLDIWKFRGIDPKTFQKTGDGEYKDKNGKYKMEDLWDRAQTAAIDY